MRSAPPRPELGPMWMARADTCARRKTTAPNDRSNPKQRNVLSLSGIAWWPAVVAAQKAPRAEHHGGHPPKQSNKTRRRPT